MYTLKILWLPHFNLFYYWTDGTFQIIEQKIKGSVNMNYTTMCLLLKEAALSPSDKHKIKKLIKKITHKLFDAALEHHKGKKTKKHVKKDIQKQVDKVIKDVS